MCWHRVVSRHNEKQNLFRGWSFVNSNNNIQLETHCFCWCHWGCISPPWALLKADHSDHWSLRMMSKHNTVVTESKRLYQKCKESFYGQHWKPVSRVLHSGFQVMNILRSSGSVSLALMNPQNSIHDFGKSFVATNFHNSILISF